MNPYGLEALRFYEATSSIVSQATPFSVYFRFALESEAEKDVACETTSSTQRVQPVSQEILQLGNFAADA